MRASRPATQEPKTSGGVFSNDGTPAGRCHFDTRLTKFATTGHGRRPAVLLSRTYRNIGVIAPPRWSPSVLTETFRCRGIILSAFSKRDGLLLRFQTQLDQAQNAQERVSYWRKRYRNAPSDSRLASFETMRFRTTPYPQPRARISLKDIPAPFPKFEEDAAVHSQRIPRLQSGGCMFRVLRKRESAKSVANGFVTVEKYVEDTAPPSLFLVPWRMIPEVTRRVAVAIRMQWCRPVSV